MTSKLKLSNLSPLKLAFAAKQARQAAQIVNAEPIAIVGIGCRFPGQSDSPELFWDLLKQGKDAVTEIPSSRFNLSDYYDPNPDKKGKMYARHGAFISSIDDFDAAFFEITPREATHMDPQQRILMEVAWEALEYGNISQHALNEMVTGVFIGISTFDYSLLKSRVQSRKEIDAYFTSGAVLSVAAGRLSYAFGLKGPAMSVDTACSSSLVSVHLACQSLRKLECNMALAGGVSLIASPDFYINFSKARMLAPDGKCKTFDARANGYVRGEGCGVVVLKRLSDAISNGDHIIALIRGSAVNQDGASGGLTVPNGPAQEKVIKTALNSCGVLPDQVSYIEAHGTGTSLGDPIEMGAIANTYGQRNLDTPLLVGSVKTNMGHLEASAGIAGLIKVALSMKNAMIPSHLNFTTPSPHIPWDQIPVKIPTSNHEWQPINGKRLASVSSFGFAGTNAHVILEESPRIPVSDKGKNKRPVYVLNLSAKHKSALNAQINQYAKYLDDHAHIQLNDLCATANTGRSHFVHRASIVASSKQDLCDQLKTLDHPPDQQSIFSGNYKNAPEIIFLFSNQSSAFPGMGRQLYESSPFFAATIDRCDTILNDYWQQSLIEYLHSDQKSFINNNLLIPALFSIEYALASLYLQWGIIPEAMIGFGAGEFTAACLSEMFSLEHALQLLSMLARQSVDDFLSLANQISFSSPQRLIISPDSGDIVSKEITNPKYWTNRLNQTGLNFQHSNFLQSMKRPVFIEPGPVYSHSNYLSEMTEQINTNVLSGLSSGSPDWQVILTNLARLYTMGVHIDWDAFEKDYEYTLVRLPSYPFQHKKYWLVPDKEAIQHPVAGYLPLPLSDEIRYSSQFSMKYPVYIPDHRIFGSIVVPCASHISMVIQAATDYFDQNTCIIQNIVVHQALIIPDHDSRNVQLLLSPKQNHYDFKILSTVDNNREKKWDIFASGQYIAKELLQKKSIDYKEYTSLIHNEPETNKKDFYASVAAEGHHQGPSFQWIDQVWFEKKAALCRLRQPVIQVPFDDFQLYPGLIDSCIQFFCAKGNLFLQNNLDHNNLKEQVFVPFSIDKFLFYGTYHKKDPLWCHITFVNSDDSGRSITGNMMLFDNAGHVIAEFIAFTARTLDKHKLRIGNTADQADFNISDILYGPSWIYDRALGFKDRFMDQSLDNKQWVIIGDKKGIALSLSNLMTANHMKHQVVETDDCTDIHWNTLLSDSSENKIIYLKPVDLENHADLLYDSTLKGCLDISKLLKSLSKNIQTRLPDFWIVTQGAISMETDTHDISLAQSSIIGLTHVLSLEFPECKIVSLDLDPLNQTDLAKVLFEEMICPDNEDRILWRAGKRYKARLKSYQLSSQQLNYEPDKTYLITGGLGALGLTFARWFSTKGVKNLALIGRSNPSKEAKNTIQLLTDANVNVSVFKADISDAIAMENVFMQLKKQMPPLGGIIHAAGALKDGFLLRLSQSDFDTVMAPKVKGSWLLHQHTKDLDLDFFICFSSMASVMGAPGQSNYAAANAFMDALVQYRNKLGMPGVSINWGAWGEIGMASRMDAKNQAQWHKKGVGQIPVHAGLELFPKLCCLPIPQIVVLPVEWNQFFHEHQQVSSFYDAFKPIEKNEPEEQTKTLPLIRQLQDKSDEERNIILANQIKLMVQQIIGLTTEEDIDKDVGLFDLGIDSLMAVELKNQIENSLGITLQSTLIFNYPTIQDITNYLQTEHLGELKEINPSAEIIAETEKKEPQLISKASDIQNEAIAVIGIGCRFPGGANDPDSFWNVLTRGTDAIVAVPSDRWNMSEYYDPDASVPGKMYTRHGGFLSDIDLFDAHFFGIPPREAIDLDPQHRLLLEVSWEALENANIAPTQLKHSQTGVFVGISTYDYAFLHVGNMDSINAYFGTGNTLSMAPGRLSYVLGLTGPSMAVDTACSSSLLSVHLACNSLRQKECNIALAGGVGLIMSPELSINFCKANMLSPDGKCKTFDAAANGYVRGEGCGTLVLKRLSDAIKDNDHIFSVIRGAAVNQDGPVAGFTVPGLQAQKRVISSALSNAGVTSNQIGYIEAHGTATPLGDPVEINALGEVFGKDDRKHPLWIGSVKTNLGHLEAAAGIAGLIKAILSIYHQQIPPHLNFQNPNPKIAWNDFPFAIPTQLQTWPSDSNFAGVSSFGASGTNVHVVIERYQTPLMQKQSIPDPDNFFLPISAKSLQSLKDLCARYIGLLEQNKSISMIDLCYSSSVCRSHFNHRLAVTGRNPDEIQKGLIAYIGGISSENVLTNTVETDSPNQVTHPFPEFKALVNAYVNGADIDWITYYQPYHVSKIQLPLYAFQHESFWVSTKNPAPVSNNIDMHPLLGHRIDLADANDIVFESRLNTKTMRYLKDHCIFEKNIFPAAAFFEMANAAGRFLWQKSAITLSDIFIYNPFVLSENHIIQTVLKKATDQNIKESIQFHIFSKANKAQSWILHVSGKLSSGDVFSEPQDLTSFIAKNLNDKGKDQIYSLFKNRGFSMGTNFQTLAHIRSDSTCACADISIQNQLDIHDYNIHPVLLDACFQTSIALLPEDTNTYLPVGMDQLVFYNQTHPDIEAKYRTYVKKKSSIENRAFFTVDAFLINDDGNTIVSAKGLRVKQVSTKTIHMQENKTPISHDMIYTIDWPVISELNRVRSLADHSKQWIIFSDQKDFGKRLGTRLKSDNKQVTLISKGASFHQVDPQNIIIDPSSQSDVKQLFDRISNAPYDIVVLAPLDIQDQKDIQDCMTLILNISQNIIQKSFKQLVNLWMITKGAQRIHLEPNHYLQSPVWGFSKVFNLESSMCHCRLIDMDPESPFDPETIAKELYHPDASDQIAIRNNSIHIPRLMPLENSVEVHEKNIQSHPVILKTTQAGILDHLYLSPLNRKAPEADEVEIKIYAAGLNFRDVLNALGMLEMKDNQLLNFGFECAGEIVSIGNHVKNWSVGDRVIAIHPQGCLASFVTVNKDFIGAIPHDMSYEACATLPSAYLTAWYGLVHLAKIKPKDHVLIHAAAGGVGQAAVQIAKQYDAEIFATASQSKWDFLKSQGIKHVMNSRSLEFAETIMELTSGKGVDIVLNSLKGAFIDKSVDVLDMQGRFVEIGKIDIWDPAHFQQHRQHASYFTFDLMSIMQTAKHIIKDAMHDLSNHIKAKKINPLPFKTYSIHQAQNAFRYMAQGKNIGKIVLTLPEKTLFKSNASYLITGGLGALGLQIAQWMIQNGAKNLMLTGRKHFDLVQNKLKELQEPGIHLKYYQSDITSVKDVRQLFQDIQSEKLELKGIIHIAGIHIDAMLPQQTPDLFKKVMGPKVDGTLHLHNMSIEKELSLDYFVCFSSAASIFGSVGQANYASANSFMDALMQYRKAQNLPALSINWGPWQEGMVSRLSEQDINRLTAQGFFQIQTVDALSTFEKLLTMNIPQAIAAPVDWDKFSNRFDPKPVPSFYGLFYKNKEQVKPESIIPIKSKILEELHNSLENERQSILIKYITKQVADVLGLQSTHTLTPRQRLTDAGIDSLMAVELQNKIAKDLETALPVTLLFDYPTIESLVNYLFHDALTFSSQTEKNDIVTSNNNENYDIVDLLEKEIGGRTGRTGSDPRQKENGKEHIEIISPKSSGI